eukprot:scaffold8319_cov277-Pinguiococcus_pyrenoidosus.AAC.3
MLVPRDQDAIEHGFAQEEVTHPLAYDHVNLDVRPPRQRLVSAPGGLATSGRRGRRRRGCEVNATFSGSSSSSTDVLMTVTMPSSLFACTSLSAYLDMSTSMSCCIGTTATRPNQKAVSPPRHTLSVHRPSRPTWQGHQFLGLRISISGNARDEISGDTMRSGSPVPTSSTTFPRR